MAVHADVNNPNRDKEKLGYIDEVLQGEIIVVDTNIGSITGYVELNTTKAEQAAAKLNAVLAKMAAQTNLLAAKASAVTQTAMGKFNVSQAQVE